MVWTLRLYDETGTEIGWVQITDDGDYSHEITHPESGWEDYNLMLNDSSRLYPDSFDSEGRSPDCRLISDPAPVSLPPEEHLSRIEDDLGDYPEVGSTELADE